MENGVGRVESPGAGSKAWARDALGAIALAEGAIAQRIFVAVSAPPAIGATNAFGDAVTCELAPDAVLGAEQCEELAASGMRVTLVTSARALASARGVMRTIAAQRLAVVFHAIADRGSADALALGDLGWGVVLASGVEDSLDLSFIARRAAEDSGTPFLVVHERSTGHHVEPLAPPTAALCEAFVGAPSARLRRLSDPAHPVHADIGERAFAERVPFALGSAMRELESLTGRRHDAVERSAGSDVSVMLVGLGSLGEALLGEAERLRAQGYDVGALKVTAYRPFPGARIVRALARALAVTVLEGADEPLAQSNPLTREIKAAFADALTWAPDYPGIGRIPRVTSGVVGSGDHELEERDLDAIVRNMLEGEGGKRLFVFGADAELALGAGHLEARGPLSARAPSFAMRGRVTDVKTAGACAELCASVVASALALKARAHVRPLSATEGDGFAFDLFAGRERPRGVHKPHALRLIVLDDGSALIRGNPLARLVEGGIVALPTSQKSAEGLWAEMPPYVKAIVFDRGARVVGFAPEPSSGDGDALWLTAAAFAGIALAAASTPTEATARASSGLPGDRTSSPPRGPHLAEALVAREVADAVRALVGSGGVELAARAGEVARRVFASFVEVPRATVERDEESVRLGRRDARASASSR